MQHDFASGWKLKANATHDQTNVTDKLFYPYYTIYGFDKSTGAGVVPYSGYYVTERNVDGLDGYAEGPLQLFGREHALMAGVSYNRRRYVNDGAYDFPSPMASYLNWSGHYPQPTWSALTEFSRGTVTQKAGYAAVRLSRADPLRLIVGARYTDWQVDGAESGVAYTSRQKETTPYAGLVYTIDAVWSAYASYTDIFQPQTSRNRNGAYLDPVIGKSYEAGVKAAWFDDRLNASLSVFRIEQDSATASPSGAPVAPPRCGCRRRACRSPRTGSCARCRARARVGRRCRRPRRPRRPGAAPGARGR